VVQSILQYRFDQIFDAGEKDTSVEQLKADMRRKSIPVEMLLKAPEEQKVSKEEENTFIVQVITLETLNTRAFCLFVSG